MGSIAYITDKKMMEYHRLHGNRNINFWKPSTKNISDFKKGDLLFFLTKGTERGERREKGILGYGHLHKQQNMSLSQMWNVYKTGNGYPDKESLKQAICKITKQETIPKQMTCMELQDVVYFQYPIYLSEIGMEISNSIESFIYIDKDNIQNSGKLLKLAESVGTDIWANANGVDDDRSMCQDGMMLVIENLNKALHTDFYSHYEEIKIYHYVQSLQDTHIFSIKQSKTEYWTMKDNKIMILLPCLLNFIDYENKLQYSIGHYLLYKIYCEDSEYSDQLEVCLLFNQKLQEKWKRALDALSITYEERLVDED